MNLTRDTKLKNTYYHLAKDNNKLSQTLGGGAAVLINILQFT